MLVPGFLSTYYIVTRLVLLISSLIAFVVLVYKGKFHEIDEGLQFLALFLMLAMLLPEVGEFIALIFIILGFGGLFYAALSTANKVSETRKLTIRAESTKDAPSSGQVSLAATQDGQLTIADYAKNHNLTEEEKQWVQEYLKKQRVAAIIGSLL